MAKIVAIRFDGSWAESGFNVNLEVRTPNGKTLVEKRGHLPANPELLAHLNQHWQHQYRNLNSPARIKPKRIVRGSTRERIQACQVSARELEKRLGSWLDDEDFRPLDKRLREELNRDEEIQVLLRTNDANLKKLPLHLWDFFASYPKAELALSPVEIESPKYDDNYPRASRVKILVIIGHRDGIDTEADLNIIKSLPQADPTILIEPEHRHINDRLWEQSWDIIFFAGHSETEGETGRIYINPHDSLTVEELWYGLRKSVERGLKLAIFNSCDGLGLARQLDDLNIPQMIVMREVVPDRIAQEFLKHFLKEFAGGESLYIAVRRARERLHDDFEREFPCASWLPVLCQNPGYIPPTWNDLILQNQPVDFLNWIRETSKIEKIKRPKWRQFLMILSVVAAATGLVWGMRSLGFLQQWELRAYDHFMQIRPEENPDPRLALVTITAEDVQSQPAAERQGASLSNRSLELLLQTLERYQPRAIGLLVYRENPIPAEFEQLKNLFATSDRLVAICEYGQPERPGVPPPPNIPRDRLGFNNVVSDPDYVLRRHLLAVNPAGLNCPTRESFSLQLARFYLANKKLNFQINSRDYPQFGDTVFKTIHQHTAGYHDIDSQGYQVMLNYRATAQIASAVTLENVLKQQVDPDKFRDRIVIIGTVDPSFKDNRWLAPIGAGKWGNKRLTGVEIEAHMVSQIISAVLDDRPLIWWWPSPVEFLWIGLWSAVGSALFLYSRSPLFLIVGNGVALIVLYGVCAVLFVQGGWIPFVPAALTLLVTGTGLAIIIGRSNS